MALRKWRRMKAMNRAHFGPEMDDGGKTRHCFPLEGAYLDMLGWCRQVRGTSVQEWVQRRESTRSVVA